MVGRPAGRFSRLAVRRSGGPEGYTDTVARYCPRRRRFVVVVVGEGGPAALRQDGVTLSWGNNLVPIRHSAPVGEETGRRAGLRGPVRLESRTTPGGPIGAAWPEREGLSAVTRPAPRSVGCCLFGNALASACRVPPRIFGEGLESSRSTAPSMVVLLSLQSLSLLCAGRAWPARTTRTGRDSSGQAPIALWVTRCGAGCRQAHADQNNTQHALA